MSQRMLAASLKFITAASMLLRSCYYCWVADGQIDRQTPTDALAIGLLAMNMASVTNRQWLPRRSDPWIVFDFTVFTKISWTLCESAKGELLRPVVNRVSANARCCRRSSGRWSRCLRWCAAWPAPPTAATYRGRPESTRRRRGEEAGPPPPPPTTTGRSTSPCRRRWRPPRPAKTSCPSRERREICSPSFSRSRRPPSLTSSTTQTHIYRQ